MQLAHSFTVPASADRTWALLTDLEQVGGCFPGATVTEATEEEFSGTVKVKLGPIAMVYSGSGRFVLRDDVDHHAVIEAQGKDKRGNGTAGATVTMQLLDEDGRTRVDVGTDLSITGKPAQFGRGVMQDVSDKLLGRFVDCIEEHLGADEDPAPPAHPASAELAVDAATPEAPTPVAPRERAAVAASEPGTPIEDDVAAHESAAAASSAVTAPGPADPPLPKPRVAEEPAVAAPRQRETDDDAIDLGGAVGPVLLRRYGPIAGAVLVGIVLVYLLRRRSSRS